MRTSLPSQLFIFGLGYTSQALSQTLVAQGVRVVGTVRTAAKAQALARQGIRCCLFDGSTPLTEEGKQWLAHSDAVLSSVPPGAEADPVLAHNAADLAAAIQRGRLRWLGYFSTTGVYGNSDGAVVTEDAPLAASRPRPQRRVRDEAAWTRLGLAPHLLRLSGIVGPGRSVRDRLRAGAIAQRIDKPGHRFNRIHVADIARLTAALLASQLPGRAWNLCDHCPEEPRVLIEFAARLEGVDPPPLVPFSAAALSPMAQDFWSDNRVVDGTAILRATGLSLTYPSWVEGLRD